METALNKKTGALWKILLLVAAFAATNGIPRIATFIQGRLYAPFMGMDPDAVFVPSFIHHIAQGLIALAVIAAFAAIQRKSLRDYGFNMNQWRWSLKTVGIFCLGWVVLYGAGALLSIPPTQTLGYPRSFRNISGYSLFMLTMPGPSEETLFRALPYLLLGFAWTGKVKVFRLEFSHMAIITALLFMVGHIGFDIVPFHIYYIDATQQVFALGLGLFYGYMLDRTGSLFGPVLVHAASDFLGNLIVVAIVLLR